MLLCVKCEREIPDGSNFCPICGAAQKASRKKPAHKRGNGKGSVYKEKGAQTWTASVTLGYEVDALGNARPKRPKKGGFKTKREAEAALAALRSTPTNIDTRITFKGLYELWFPTHENKGKSSSTMGNYQAAFNHYKDIWYIEFAKITLDDLQKCLDNCPRGRRTLENMKALGTLLYDYAIARDYVPPKNLAHYLYIRGEAAKEKNAFTKEEIEIIRQSIGTVPYADYIYCQIYLGFRPSELLELDVSSLHNEGDIHYFIGGRKTEAGTNRPVTISPKIQPIIERLVCGRTEGKIFRDLEKGTPLTIEKYRKKCFYPALQQMGLPQPAPDGTKRELTPHCCRHTFATLLKDIDAPDKDKLKLMGHTSVKMLQHYQHTDYEDLKSITDKI